MSEGATNKRAVDTNKVVNHILQYLQPSPEHTLGIAVPSSLPKEQRGLEHHITGRFLIPRQHLDAFEKDPARSVINSQWSPQLTTHQHSVLDGYKDVDSDWILVAEDWPTFLYDERAGWNERDVRNGLFRGHVLVRVSAAHSMTGLSPSSSSNPWHLP